MNQLLKIELTKILKLRMIYVLLFMLLLITSSYLLNSDHITEEELEIYHKLDGELTEEKMEKAQEASTDQVIGQDSHMVSTTEKAKKNIYRAISSIPMIEEKLVSRVSELSEKNSSSASMEKAMINEIDVSSYSYHKGPEEIIDYTGTFAFIITGAMLLAGLSSIYTREYTSKIDHYILSSKKGKSTLVWAKISAALIYTFIVMLIWEVWNLVTKGWIFTTEGWENPIQYKFGYHSSPYPLTMGEYHIIQLSIHLLAAISFALLVLLISSKCRNSLFSFMVSGAVFGIPYTILEIVELPYWLKEALQFNFLQIMRVDFLFDEFKTISLFGYPLIYPLAAVALMVVIGLVCLLINIRTFKHKEITY
ncbi:hypothetical protein [Halobacillus sp. B29]|uniref:hypothetical protein n=1 Tax=Halobacillus sp. B29 TaxID=3457432 RepID=UPI003FCDD23B